MRWVIICAFDWHINLACALTCRRQVTAKNLLKRASAAEIGPGHCVGIASEAMQVLVCNVV
jgi:hypothetical protein